MGGTSSWVQLSPAGSAPEGRNQTSAVYDPVSNRLIVHGGFNANVVSLNDAWALTFANGLGGTAQWLALPSSPIGRVGHASAYDAVNNRMMIFAGNTGPPGTERNDVWILKDANGNGAPSWEQLLPATGPTPTPRTHSQAVYDRLSNRLIVFGGRGGGLAFNDAWVLSNANGLGGTPQWMQLLPGGIAPAPRGGHVMFYDSGQNRCVVFGGGDEQANPVFNDSWILTEANGLGGISQWIHLDPDGGPPPARFWPSAGYSTMANRLIITMGNQTSFPYYLSDTWVLTERIVTQNRELIASADSFVRSGADDTNEGANERLRIQSSGHNRAVVKFDISSISTVGLQTATLVLNIAENSNNWGSTGRLVDAHSLLEQWTEGNGHDEVMVPGVSSFRGRGEGVTWHCAHDANISNQRPDCASPWNGGRFAATTAAGALHTNGLLGEVSWDVTADVMAGANFGWVVKKREEGQPGQVRYFSREGATRPGNPNLAPRLILVYAQ